MALLTRVPLGPGSPHAGRERGRAVREGREGLGLWGEREAELRLRQRKSSLLGLTPDKNAKTKNCLKATESDKE